MTTSNTFVIFLIAFCFCLSPVLGDDYECQKEGLFHSTPADFCEYSLCPNQPSMIDLSTLIVNKIPTVAEPGVIITAAGVAKTSFRATTLHVVLYLGPIKLYTGDFKVDTTFFQGKPGSFALHLPTLYAPEGFYKGDINLLTSEGTVALCLNVNLRLRIKPKSAQE